MHRTFFTSCPHFGHERLIEIQSSRSKFNSIEEHDETIIENWNNAVRQKDTIWLLGDCVFGVKNLKKLGMLKGIKKLILGNHDQYNIKKYIPYFNQIYGSMKYKKIYWLTHQPVQRDYAERWKVNIHGHIHDNVRFKKIRYESAVDKPDLVVYYNVGMDFNDFTPVEFSQIRDEIILQ